VIRDGPSSPSRSRCVSVTAVSGRPTPRVAEPVSRGANADRPDNRRAHAACAGDPRQARKGGRSC
jgi:hypothetical protein